MRDEPIRYDEPFAWWGPGWRAAPAPGIVDLLDDGVLSAAQAARLLALVERRVSLVVAAGPSRAGKTTLLTALAALLPEPTRRIYLRGCYEPFAFLTDPTTIPGETTLLINEISPHLPVYLWGSGARRALQAGRAGFQLLATAHARTIDELVALLAGPPLRAPLAEVAALQVVALLDRPAGSDRFQLSETWGLAPTPRGGLLRVPLDDDRAAAEFDASGPEAARLVVPPAEIERRQRLLTDHPERFRLPRPPWRPGEPWRGSP